jgi:FkbM family methyltransferase
MNISRIIKGGLKLKRYNELFLCFHYFDNPLELALGYLGIKHLKYPRNLTYKKKYQLEIHSWEDLTTAWVVLLGNEYRIMSTDKIIVDFGANIGAFALLAGSLNPNALIVAVEPFPDNFTRCQKTVSNNSLNMQVVLKKCAVSGKNGGVAFDSSDLIPSHSRRISTDRNTSQQVMVPSSTLETFLKNEALTEVDFVKMDIEGAEYDVILKSSSETLRKVKRYGIEFHAKGHAAISKHFENAGFKVTYFPKKGNSGIIEYTRMPKMCEGTTQ